MSAVDLDSSKRISWWFHILFPVQTLWKRDKTYLLIFVVVNIIAGQVGVLTSLLLASQGDGSLFDAWMKNLSSAALYTFSISLVVSSLALVGSELIDSIRFQNDVKYFEYKIVWSVLALAILLLQAPLAGALLSGPERPLESAQLTKQQEINTNRQPDGGHAQTTSVIPSNNNVATGRQAIQVVFWIASMIIALLLFCLYRIPLISDKSAQERNKEVQELAEKADSQTSTKFGEAI